LARQQVDPRDRLERSIHIARLDKARPVLVLTRSIALPHLTRVTVAPITTTVKGLSTEVLVGPENGLEHECAISLDNVLTIQQSDLGRQIGFLFEHQEAALAEAIQSVFALHFAG
jgi:mRNA interferase MazF